MKHISLGEYNFGVIYFIWEPKGPGTGHSPLLLVSLQSLRRYYKGNVCLLTPEPNTSLIRKIEESKLNVCVRHIPLSTGRRNTANCTKTTVHRWSPFDCNLFIDADTIITGMIEDAFPSKEQELSVTKFSDWRVKGSPYEARIERFRNFCPDLVEKAFSENGPAINTGVFGFWRDAKALNPVNDLTLKARSVFIPDEIAMQLLYQEYPHILLEEKFNLSVKFGKNWRDARIVHAHGSKIHWPTIKDKWLELFREVWSSNIAEVRSWCPPTFAQGTPIENEVLKIMRG